MLDRITEAFTKPRLQQTPIDELIVAVACLVTLAIVGAVVFLAWQWLVGGTENPRIRHAKRQVNAPVVSSSPVWHYSEKTTTSPAPPPKRA